VFVLGCQPLDPAILDVSDDVAARITAPILQPVKQLTTVFTPHTGCHEFLRLRQMVVIVELFTWHIVFRNLVRDHLCHIWISRIFDTVYGVSFERITFFG
jgi:hypothetical protein